MNKYHAIKTWSELCQRTFDSKLEARRGEELRLLEMGGEISGLEYQTKRVLSRTPKVTISIDFCYYDNTSKEWIYEDAKGKLMADFRVKMAWVKEKYGIDIKLWKG